MNFCVLSNAGYRFSAMRLTSYRYFIPRAVK